jgi:hypothetical protein
MIRRILKKLSRLGGLKTWQSAQSFELDHAIGFMKAPSFRRLHADTVSGNLRASQGHFSELLVSEFFDGDRSRWDDFAAFLSGKHCLDVGPCVYSPLACWDQAAERHAIEPLFEGVDRWQRENLGASVFEGIRVWTEPAEKTIPELLARIDGAIYCRNMLDHSPYWPFALVNLSKYAKSGCKLLLWTDLDHGATDDEGHFNITTDAGLFRDLVLSLGFRLEREFSKRDPGKKELNWGCFGEKI